MKKTLSFGLAAVITFLVFDWANFILWDINYFPTVSLPTSLYKPQELQLGGTYYLEPGEKMSLRINLKGLVIFAVQADGPALLRGDRQWTGRGWGSLRADISEEPEYYITHINNKHSTRNERVRFDSIENLDTTKAVTVRLGIFPLEILKGTSKKIKRHSNQRGWIDTQLETMEGDFPFLNLHPYKPGYYLGVKGFDGNFKKLENGKEQIEYEPALGHRKFSGVWKISQLRLPAGRLYFWGNPDKMEITVYHILFDNQPYSTKD